MEWYFKRKKRYKILCFLIIFALLLEIPMPAIAAGINNTGTTQADNTANSADENSGLTAEAGDTSEDEESTDEVMPLNLNAGSAAGEDKTNIFDSYEDGQGIESILDFGEAAADDASADDVATTDHEALIELTDLRESNVKYFQNTDGTQTAYVYNHDVHYLDGDGEYEDIDNSLTETETAAGKEVMTTGDNASDFILAQDASDGNTVSIRKDGYNLKWRLLSAEESQAQDTTALTNGGMSQMLSAPDPTSVEDTIASAEYNGILQNVDLEYVLVGSEIKENITLNSAKVPSQFAFVLTTTSTLFAKESEGQIYFEDAGGETVFHMSEALMFDANGAESTDIQVKLATLSETEESHQYKLTITPSKVWLNEESRVYPVVLDPTITTTQTAATISDTHVNSDYPNNNNATSVSRLVGTMTGGKSSRTYIKFSLPSFIQKSDRIVSASFSLHSNTENVNSLFYDYATSGPTMYMFAPNADWNESTLTWSNQPGYTSEATIDYSKIEIIDGSGGKIARRGWYDWDVTSMVDGWYNGAPNYGVMIKDAENLESTYAKRVYFHSTNDVDYSDRYPVMQISYMNMIGLEDYWTYHTQSAGLAGTGFVNDFTGGLTTTFNDYTWDSELLSLSVSHVYNSDNYNKAQSSLDVGYGFMLSLQENLKMETVNGITLYRYIDGDGTQHYFQYSDGKWTDDSGLGLTLTMPGGGLFVTDKSHNVRRFDSITGYLKEIKDNDGNKITLEYSPDGKYLYHAYDNAGHMLSFNPEPNNSKRLGWITVKETSHPNDAIKQIHFTYDSSGHLTQVTFPGKSTVDSSGVSGADNIAQFGYTPAGTLNSLKDTTNGMRVDYSYELWENSNQRPRVKEFKVYDASNNVESSYTMAYSPHCTRFTETYPALGRNQVYIFNYMGQTISAQDQDDNALFCETGLAGGAKNKVTFASKAQQSVTNLLKNHDFEKGTASYGTIGNASFSIDSSHAFYGNNCFKIQTSTASSGYSVVLQGVEAKGGQSYTLSGYIKTEGCTSNGACLRLVALDSVNGNLVEFQSSMVDKIVSENGYMRFETTLDLTSYSSSKTYWLYLYTGLLNVNYAATAYIDSLQLETGNCANRYNLLENSNLESSLTGTWGTSGTTSSDMIVSGSDVTRRGTGNCYRFWGDAAASKNISQSVTVNGESGDSYVFGCWIKSKALPNKDPGDGSKQCIGMTLKFANTDGTSTFKSILITPTANEWQYICASAIAAKNYTTVTVYLKDVYNRNYTWFDDVQLYKDSFGDSFTYDSKGNVISVVDKAKNTASAAVNGTDDTTSYTDGKGQTYGFVYNGDNSSTSTKHNLTESTAPDDTSSTFVYNSFGNVTQTDQHSSYSGNIATICSSIGYTSNGAYKTSSTDQRNLTSLYTYNEKFGLLVSTSIPVGLMTSSDMLTTANTYDLDTRKVTEISSSFVDTVLKYGYTQNRPSSIQIGNAGAYLKYGYSYDNAGNMTGISRSSSGNTTPTTLESYAYIDGRGLKSSQTYANGQTLNYTYDNQDRLIGVSQGSNQISKYVYDGNGLLSKAFSYGSGQTVTNITTNQYDLADRLISSMNSKGSGIYDVSYDKNNLATGYNSYLRDGYANLEYKSTYAYIEKDANGKVAAGVDKPLTDYLNVGSGVPLKTDYTYDFYGRPNTTLTSTGSSISHIEIGYGYLSIDANKTTSMPSNMAVRYSTVPNSDESPDIRYNLTYDRSGNITDILTELKDSPNYTKTYTYDNLSRLTGATNVANSGDNYAYTYDGRNNITGSTVTNDGTTMETKSYTYAADDIDRLSSFSHTTADGTVTRNYTCDSVGNPTAIAETNSADNSTRNLTLGWTQGKLLSNISDGAGLNNTYSYDADGNISKKVLADGSYVVYHYSDGSLEYEEHFNSGNVLQEVLKYCYDANGNVEYLLFKDGNFSTATSYDLYYYVRNATGDITDLFQTREQSGTGTLEVNRLAAHYEYDPYGNILSVDKYNNDPIGDINPIRYKDYYYDAQTGWYQLGSRFYDPEVGRFLNADDVSLLMESDSGVVDKNLYAYCDGNPVMRKDNRGECWVAGIVFGAAFGAAFEIADQMIIEGKSWKDVDKGAVVKAAAVGALTGAFGRFDAIATGIATGISSYRENNGSLKKAVVDGAVAAGLSYVCGKGGMKIASKISSRIKTSVPQKHYVERPLKKWQKKLHKGLGSFYSSFNYWVYHGALYHSGKRK